MMIAPPHKLTRKQKKEARFRQKILQREDREDYLKAQAGQSLDSVFRERLRRHKERGWPGPLSWLNETTGGGTEPARVNGYRAHVGKWVRSSEGAKFSFLFHSHVQRHDRRVGAI